LKHAPASRRSYGLRLELAEGTSPRGPPCLCVDKTGNITLLRCIFAELFFSCCEGVAAPQATAWAPRSSTCDAQRGNGLGAMIFNCAAPRAPAWAPRSSTCDAQRGNGLGTTIKYLRHITSGAAGNGLGTTIKDLRRTTKRRPGPQDQVPVTHNERRRGQRPGRHDQVSVRRRGHRHGHHDQITTTHNEAAAWAPWSSTCDAQRAAPRATA
jgi:hypothetical protein